MPVDGIGKQCWNQNFWGFVTCFSTCFDLCSYRKGGERSWCVQGESKQQCGSSHLPGLWGSGAVTASLLVCSHQSDAARVVGTHLSCVHAKYRSGGNGVHVVLVLPEPGDQHH